MAKNDVTCSSIEFLVAHNQTQFRHIVALEVEIVEKVNAKQRNDQMSLALHVILAQVNFVHARVLHVGHTLYGTIAQVELIETKRFAQNFIFYSIVIVFTAATCLTFILLWVDLFVLVI